MVDFFKKKGLFYITFFLLLQVSGSTLLASEKTTVLKVSLLIFSVEQRNAFEQLATAFNQRYPSIRIQYVSQDDANYKENSALWLENPDDIDVLNWPWPGRFEEFVNEGRIEPVSDLWQDHIMQAHYSQSDKDLVSVGRYQYAIPYSKGYWGFFYRDSLFKKLGIRVPKNWQDFLKVGQILKDNQVTPIAIGTKHPWPTGSWFDYLNLRINGMSFHRDVAAGEVPFSDERIHAVFNHWRELIKGGYFNEGAIHVDIRQLLPLLYRHDAGMMLAGSYMTTQIPPSIRDDFKFFRFPIINETITVTEETPTDMFLIPASSKNKVAAKKFLVFMSEAGSQRGINDTINNLSPNGSEGIGQSYFLEAAQSVLTQATNYTQYFDRDAPYDFAQDAFAVFARFIEDGDIQKAQASLEQVRQQHFASED
jgi:multiple sugar transport system substrate-binding protein